MYLYFDSGGTLKEIINDKPLRQNSSGWNTIFVYWEENTILMNKTKGNVKYILSDNNEYIVNGTNWIEADAYVNEEIPFNQYRDLTHFKYHKNYRMFKFVIPDNVLAVSGVLGVVVRIENDDSQFVSMERIACMVEQTANAGSVYSGEDCIGIDTTISVAEYNDLVRRIEEASGGDCEMVEIAYNSTSFADIGAILTNHKIPYCYYNARLYIYTDTIVDGADVSIVLASIGDKIYKMVVDTSSTYTLTETELGSSDLFPVTFGTTPYNDIVSAISSGKIPYCVYSGDTYYYTGSATNSLALTNIKSTSINYIGVATGDIYTTASISLQPLIDATHKLSADLVDDSDTTNKFTNATEKSTWNAKQNALTTSSVNDGTISKVIGFDSGGNIVKGTITGGSGTQLYVHTVTATTNAPATATFKVYSADADAYTDSTLLGKLTTALQITTNKESWGTVFCVYDYGLFNIYMVQSSISSLISLVGLQTVSDSVVAL